MLKFSFKAKDGSGKTVTGRRPSSSREDIITELQRENLTVVSVEEISNKKKESSRKMFGGVLAGRKVKTFDLVIFCRQLSTMLEGGVPILRAIESIATEVRDKNFKNILHKIARDLKEGKTLSESFKKYPNAFSDLFNAIVEAGEKVGSLDKMLGRLSGYLEARDRLVKKMRSATTYPAFIAFSFLVAVAVITLFLIPKFQSVYSDFGAELPTLTLIIFNVSNFVIQNIAVVLVALVVVIFSLFVFIRHTRAGRAFFDRALLGLPIFGDVIKKAAMSKFSRTLSTLLDQGISITEAFLLVGRTSGNIIIEDAGRKASELITGGEEIPGALEKTRVFPPLMLQMVSVGVESGSLPELLDKTADFYEEQVDTFVSTLTAAIEPILVISLGTVIAVVVVALYMPIFKLGSAMSGGQ